MDEHNNIISSFVFPNVMICEWIRQLFFFNFFLYTIDLASDDEQLMEICKKHKFYACFIFAGLKAVGESVEKPLLYYRVNLNIALNLIKICSQYNCNNFIFSSSATVYRLN